jgi:hypothetical protein
MTLSIYLCDKYTTHFDLLKFFFSPLKMLRRYKVRRKIAKKQIDYEKRQAVLNDITISAYSSSGISGSHKRVLTMGSFNQHAHSNNREDSDGSHWE